MRNKVFYCIYKSLLYYGMKTVKIMDKYHVRIYNKDER